VNNIGAATTNEAFRFPGSTGALNGAPQDTQNLYSVFFNDNRATCGSPNAFAGW